MVDKNLHSFLSSKPSSQLSALSLDSIEPNLEQDRRDWDSPETIAHIEALSVSIIADGDVNQPIEVMKPINGKYLLIDGECRYRAATKAGLSTISAIIRLDYDLNKSREHALQTQVNKLLLSPVALARALKTRIDKDKLTIKDLKRITGKSDTWLSRRLALLDLPKEIITLADDGVVSSPESLIKLSKLPSDEIETIVERIRAKELSLNEALKPVERKPKQNKKIQSSKQNYEQVVILIETARLILLNNDASLMLQSDEEVLRQWTLFIDSLDEEK